MVFNGINLPLWCSVWFSPAVLPWLSTGTWIEISMQSTTGQKFGRYQLVLLRHDLPCCLYCSMLWACFLLSPVALAVVLGYSYTKRFTWLCHLVLGLGLSLAPVGAYLAVAGQFDWIPVLYAVAVLLWVAGFDVIYALQDESFDRTQGLFSIPSYFGKARALRISAWMHLGTAVLMVMATRMLFSAAPQTGWMLWTGTAIFLGLLFYQHLLVKPDDLRKVNLAFFTTNGIASLLFGAMTILDLLL